MNNLAEEPETNVETLIKTKIEKQELISKKEIEIHNLENDLEILNKKIFKTCNHKWVVDEENSYMHTRRHCEKCKLPTHYCYR
tara:strand:- start:3348 stop:3596 length:249 start_codon:yes stop_codon:yes gene_type:complete